MANNYINSIDIGIRLQPKQEIKDELQSILNQIGKQSNIDLHLNTQSLEHSLKNLNNIIDNLGTKIQNNLDFSKIDTKGLAANINKSIDSINFNKLQTSLIEQFAEEAGIRGGEKLSKAFINSVKKNWSNGEIQNILNDALALNEKNISQAEKQLTMDFKTEELQRYVGFLREIHVLNEKLKVQGQTISLNNIPFADDEIAQVKKAFGKMIKIDDVKGIGIDKVISSWTDAATKFGFTLDGVIQDQVFKLADIVATYRDIKKNGVSTVPVLSSADEEQQIEKIKKAYFDLVEALEILDKQKDGINSSLINGDKNVQEIKNVEQALGGLNDTTQRALNIDDVSGIGKLEQRAENIRNTVDSLAKIKINLDADGNLSSATISYTDNVGKAVTETMAWKKVLDETGAEAGQVFDVVRTSITDNVDKIKQAQTALNNADYLSAQKEAYSQLSNWQKEEYLIKKELINAEGEYKKTLEDRLVTIKLLEQSQRDNIVNNNLTSVAQENKLLAEKEQLIKKANQASQKEQQAVQELIQKETKLLEIKKQGMLHKDSKADTSAIDEAINKMKQLNNLSLKELKNQITYIKAELNAASGDADSFMSRLGKSLSSIGLYVDAGDIFRGIVNQAKAAAQSVIETENAMINLTRVVEMTDSQAKEFANSMHELALKLGSSSAETIDTVATFVKLGHTLQEATLLGEVTSKYNAAADINDMNQATLSLISTLKAYHLDAMDAVSVTDDINEVTNRYAVTAYDINDILQRSAATMSTFGNSLQENIALGTVANEVMQDAAKVGNALKSIAARITTNKNALKELDAMGISIEDMNGNLKSTYQLFGEMAEQVQNMKGEELARVANNLFGKEQMSVALSIIQNIEQLDKVMGTLENTTGSVDKEFARYLNSTDAKINQLKENISGLYAQFVNTDMTHGTVDALNFFITTIKNVIEQVGALPTVLATVAASLTLFNSKFREFSTSFQPAKITEFISKMDSWSTKMGATKNKMVENIATQKTLITTQNQTGMSFVTARAKLVQYQTQLGLAAAAQTALTIGAKALGVALNMALGVGVGLVLQGLTEWVTASQRAKEENEALLSSMQQTKSEISTISDLESQFTSLSKTLQSGTLTEKEALSTKAELQDVYKQLIQACPQLEGALNLENGKYEENIELIKQAIELKKQQLKLDAEKYLTNNDISDDGIQQKIDKIKELEKSIQGFASKSLMTDNDLINSGDMTIFGKIFGAGDDRRKFFEQLKNESKQELANLGNELQNDLSQINTAQKLGLRVGISEDSKTQISQAITEINQILNTSSQSLDGNTNSIQLNEEALGLLVQAQNELSTTGIVTNDTLARLNEACPELGMNADNAREILDAMGDSIEGLGNKANQTVTDLDKIAQAFNGLSNTNAEIDAVIEDMKELGGITEDTYGKIIDNPDVIAALSAEGDTIQNLIDLKKANQQEMENEIDKAFEKVNNCIAANNAEADSKITSDVAKTESDAEANTILQENAINTAEVQSSTYGDDTSNFEAATNDKIGMHDDVNSALTTTSAAVVSTLGDTYGDDATNFKNATNDKISMLSKFKELVKSATAWVQTKISNAMDALRKLGSQDVDGINLDTDSGDPGSGTVNSSYSKKGSSGINIVSGNKTSSSYSGGTSATKRPTMVANPSKSTSGSGSKKTGSGSGSKTGKTEAEKAAEEAAKAAEKAAEEAAKYAEKIQELQSAIDIDRYLDLNNALELVNNEMTALKTEQATLSGAAYQQSLSREIELLKSKQVALAAINDEQKRETEELAAYLKKYGFYFDATGKLINSQQRLLEIQNSVNAMGGNTEEELEKKQEWVDWVQELQDKTKAYYDLVNSKIPSVTNQWNELGNSIRNAQISMLESVRDKLADAVYKELQKEVNRLKEEAQKAQDDAKAALEEEKNSEIAILDTRIKKLKEQLAALDDEEGDKKEKLAKLKAELEKWSKDDSAFSKKQIADLKDQIAALEKDIKKDEINAQIDALEDEKKETEDYYADELEKLEDKYKDEMEIKEKAWEDMLSMEKAYQEADRLLKEKNMTEITKLLSSYAENFKDIGTLLGTNFAEALNAEIKGAMDSLDSLLSQSTNNNSSITGNSGSSNGTTSKPNSNATKYVWVDEGATTRIFTDSTGTKSKGTLWENGIASADKLIQGERKNGFYEIFDLNGKSLGWVDATKVRTWYDKVSAFATGGRTPSDIGKDGALSILHANEAILNAKDTEKLDAIYNNVVVSQDLLDRLGSYLDLSNKLHEPIMPNYDYNRILGGNTTNNTDHAVTVNNEINITNNTKDDSYFNARSLEKMFKNQIRTFG